MRKTMLALAAAMVVVCARAEAATYTFQPTAFGSIPPNIPIVFHSFSLTVADSAIRSGSFDYSYVNTYPTPIIRGNAADLINFTINGIASINGGDLGLYQTSIDLLFDATGSITAGRVSYSDDGYGIEVAGTSSGFSGTYIPGSFANTYFVSGNLVGAFANVPEPAALSLLSVSLAIIGIRRRCER